MNEMYRQGDVLLVRIDPPNLSQAEPMPEEGGRVVLAHGEATGHAHTIEADYATLYMVDGAAILHLERAATLAHEEQAPIELPSGDYSVVRQRVYSES
ncbi:MAG: hypothetical protein IH850_04900, partial [Acidobacteria bacterium]|nr:hypothetical protein [Acidobacteriota bacterium]